MPDHPGGRAELLICVLNEPSFLDDVLAAFLEAGITTATVLESQGMGRLLSRDMPIFASFRHILTGSSPYSYTIVAPVSDPESTGELVVLLQDVLSTAPQEDRGFILSLPLRTYVRLTEDED
jgi:nitrogen regulatory protein P-II 1